MLNTFLQAFKIGQLALNGTNFITVANTTSSYQKAKLTTLVLKNIHRITFTLLAYNPIV